MASEAPTRLLVGREALGRSDGTALVQSATSDMGPGTYTTQTMMAADAFGLPLHRVRFALGESSMPNTPATHLDHRYGRIINPSLAAYHVSVNTDIPEVETIFIEEAD